MRRLLLATVAALALSAAPAHAGGDASCLEPRSWIGGSTALCDGAIVHGDYVDDDYGADAGQRTTSHTADLAPTAGDQSYPEGAEATADLVRLTLTIEGDRLRVKALYNAIYGEDSTTLAIAIDSDANPLTGGGKWPALNVVSTGWDQYQLFSTANPETNTIEGTMPLPPGDRWRIQAASAISQSGQVMNVAFRGVDEVAGFKGNDPTTIPDPGAGSWFEDRQAAALRTGNISEFGYEVDVADLRGGTTREQPPVTGLHERVYTSDYTIAQGEGRNEEGVPGRGDGGQGVALGFEQTFQYLGRYQPYGIYIPEKPGPHGMQMVFHGSGSVMSALINQPGMQQRFGEDLNRILVVPEARGQNGFGSDVSERDLLDVMADVERNYDVDRDKVFAGGYSQGGYITYRMAMLYPHRFAGAVDWVGFTGDSMNGTPAQGSGYTAGAVGNMIDFVGNLRRVPTFMLYSGADELVHVQTGLAMQAAFEASDNVFTFYQHPIGEHFTFAGLDDWRKEAADTAGLERVKNPPRVTYRTANFLADPEHGIRHDRAYWISQIRGRTDDYQDVDLTNHACAGTVPVTETGNGSGPDPVPWTSSFRRQTGLEKVSKRNYVEGTLRNIASLRIASRTACLRGEPVGYRIETDGPTTIDFRDGRVLRLPDAGKHSGVIAAPRAGRCTAKRRVRFRFRRSRGIRVVKAVAFVNGKRRLVRRGRDIDSIVLRRLPRRKFTVRIVTTHNTGARIESIRTFKGCRKTKPRTRRRGHG